MADSAIAETQKPIDPFDRLYANPITYSWQTKDENGKYFFSEHTQKNGNSTSRGNRIEYIQFELADHFAYKLFCEIIP
ncbi:hypothetical protein [Cytobacillus horneckiae]|uniref:hypothetical protein n=1 Tax=Cytobacillus horneckiae TaxID=549687 RepID=UPI00203EECC9|nr:hypothetical protein [Cytobacillus horneckiae]MCM3177550.1 hypothetical protein [Cytobacillus horneckiae]